MSERIGLYKEIERKVDDGCSDIHATGMADGHFNSHVHTLARYAGTLLMGDVILTSKYSLQECPIEKQKEEFRSVIQIRPDTVECWVDARDGFAINRYLIEECDLSTEQIKMHLAPIKPETPLWLIKRMYGADLSKIISNDKLLFYNHHFSVRNGGEGVEVRQDED